jgi:ribosomal protein S18 acetylase RimI-like enzyme
MIIVNSTITDIDTIFELYDEAIAFQKKVFHLQWEGFERSLVEKEIAENRQWKILINEQVACIFVLTYSDAQFWKEKDQQPAIYIHRIVTHPKFRGAAFVRTIIAWAKEYCLLNKKQFIRMDTWGSNQKLIDYYTQCGFTYLGNVPLDNTEGLPSHYKGTLALFEIAL